MAYETGPIEVLAPTMGNINVLAVTTSASAEQDTGECPSVGGRYFTFIADVACYVTFHSVSGAITDPDSTATSGNARTWLIPANTPTALHLSSLSRYFKARGSGSGFLRWYRSGRSGTDRQT